MSNSRFKYLDSINSPEDLRSLPSSAMPEVAGEIRELIVDVISKNGGHLASNLGVVELTIALHRVFNTPYDKVIFDVGHQCYAHKILTGRRDRFASIRLPGGLSGFEKREESVYDAFGTGHSSTSISAALGFAESDKIKGNDNFTIAVIGDGAFTGGMIHEALNNCRKDLKLIIVLNENEMSISKNIGGFAKYIAKIRSSENYYKTKRNTGRFIKSIPFIGNSAFDAVRKLKQMIKNVMYGSNYFEELGLYYLGPVDGNDYQKVERLFKEAREANQSAVIHLKTKKGKGYEPAEQDPTKFHGFSPKNKNVKNFSAAAGEIITRLAAEDENICAITAAMSYSTGLEPFKAEYTDRFFDVGIAEQHALTFAAGMAANGMKPVFAVYSSFLQRGYDSIIHDIAIQDLPVVICVDRAGLNLSDGITHHGIYDVAFLSTVPGMKIYTPYSFSLLESSLRNAFSDNCPSAIRYSNCSEDEEVLSRFSNSEFCACDYDDAENKSKIIITYGKIVSEAIKAEDMLGSECGIILLSQIKPYDECVKAVLNCLPKSGAQMVFLEEGIYDGGAGVQFKDRLETVGYNYSKYSVVAIEEKNIKNKVTGNIYEDYCISANDIVKSFS